MFSLSVLHSTRHHCPVTALAPSLWRQSKSPRTWAKFEAHPAKGVQDLGVHQEIGDCHTSKRSQSHWVLASGDPGSRGKTMLFSWLQEAGWWQPMRAYPDETSLQVLCWSLCIPWCRVKPQGLGRTATATPAPPTDTVGNFGQQNSTLAVPKATAISNSVSNQVKALFHSRMTRLSSMQRVVAKIDCSSHG